MSASFDAQMAIFNEACEWHFVQACKVMADGKGGVKQRLSKADQRRLTEIRMRNKQVAREAEKFVERYRV